MAQHEKITLVGGPGEGERLDWGGGDLLKWKPICARDAVAIRMHGREAKDSDPVVYRRSVRTRSFFVYQP